MTNQPETPAVKYFGEYTEEEKEVIRARLRASPLFSKDISDERLDEMIKSQANWMAENPEKLASTVQSAKKLLSDPSFAKMAGHVVEVVSRSGGLS